MRGIWLALLLVGCYSPVPPPDCADPTAIQWRAESRETTCSPDLNTSALSCGFVLDQAEDGCTRRESSVCTNGITRTTVVSFDADRPATGSSVYQDKARECRVVFTLSEVPHGTPQTSPGGK